MRALGLALLALVFPASAAAESVRDTYTRLADRHLTPAPLVFTTVPSPLRPLGRTLASSGTRRGYALRLSNDDDAVIALEGGTYRNTAAAFRDFKLLGLRRSPTRVRGHRGYLLRRSGEYSLMWIEDGRIYVIGTGTPRTVSLSRLRSTATALDHLGIARYGSGGDPENESSGFVVTTEHTVTAYVEFSAPCRYAGSEEAVLIPRTGNTFSFPITSPWSGTVNGTIGADAITLSLRATQPPDCDTGPLTLTLDART